MVAVRFGLCALFVFMLVGEGTSAKACVPQFGPVTILTRQEALAACERGDMMGCRRAKLIARACVLGDLWSCGWILDEDTFRAHELALSAIRAQCFAGNLDACLQIARDDRFDASTRAFAAKGRCLIGIAGECKGFPEPEPETEAESVSKVAAPIPPPETCRGEVSCLARNCTFHGLACVEACAAADPSSCALLEKPDFDPEPLTRKLEAQCRRGKTASCVSVWALNGAHVCSRSAIPPERFAKGRQALERACQQGWNHGACDGPPPAQNAW